MGVKTPTQKWFNRALLTYWWSFKICTSLSKQGAVHVIVRDSVTSHLSLDHSWPLCSEHLHRLENINHTFVTHPFQDDAKGDKDSGPAHASTANTKEKKVYSENAKHVLCTQRVNGAFVNCAFLSCRMQRFVGDSDCKDLKILCTLEALTA